MYIVLFINTKMSLTSTCKETGSLFYTMSYITCRVDVLLVIPIDTPCVIYAIIERRRSQLKFTWKSCC